MMSASLDCTVPLKRLRTIHVRAQDIDPRPYTSVLRQPEFLERIAQPLERLLEEALDAIMAIEQCCPEELAGGQGPGLAESETTLAVGALWRQVGDLCFTARCELRRCGQHLHASKGSYEEHVVACEIAKLKLRRGSAAILGVAAQAGGLPDPAIPPFADETATAVAVRQMYGKFRASLVACGSEEVQCVRRSLRYAAVSLAIMFGDSPFSDVRMADRRMLLSLQARIMAWLRSSMNVGEGLRLYQDIRTAADLLQGINLRQELQAHDFRVVSEAVRELPQLFGPDACRAGLRRLEALRGRDDELDALLRCASDADLPTLRSPLMAILSRLEGELATRVRH